jgi:hypothetical protein
VAGAAAPVFSAPVPVAADAPEARIGALPRALLAADGRTTVAWPGMPHGVGRPPTGREGVFVSELPPGGGTFSPPLKLSNDSTGGLLLESNAGGTRVLGWTTFDRPPEQSSQLTVAPPGLGFGPVEQIPTAPRAPATDPGVSEDSRDIFVSSLAVAPDGSVLVGYIDKDRRAEDVRGIVVVRRPDGTWTEPQVLEDQLLPDQGPMVAADGAGGLHALWSAAPHDGSGSVTTIYTADAPPGGGFGDARALSAPEPNANNGMARLVTNRRGDILAVWQVGNGPGAFDQIVATLHPSGGDWLPPRVLSDTSSLGGTKPTGALDDVGDALVVSADEIRAYASFRPARGDWGPLRAMFVGAGTNDEVPAALDAGGRGLLTSAAARGGDGSTNTILAFVLPRGGAPEGPITVSAGGETVSRPQIATDPFGNGVVVWLRGPGNGLGDQPSTVFAAGYSAAPPDLSSVVAKRSAFALKVNEPARVTVTVSGRHRRAVQWSRVRRGKSTLAFNGKVRALVARHGHYKATFRARDAGPRASRARTITFKR